MTKKVIGHADMIEYLRKEKNLSRRQATDIVNGLLGLMTEHMMDGGEVDFKKLGRMRISGGMVKFETSRRLKSDLTIEIGEGKLLELLRKNK